MKQVTLWLNSLETVYLVTEKTWNKLCNKLSCDQEALKQVTLWLGSHEAMKQVTFVVIQKFLSNK